MFDEELGLTRGMSGNKMSRSPDDGDGRSPMGGSRRPSGERLPLLGGGRQGRTWIGSSSLPSSSSGFFPSRSLSASLVTGGKSPPSNYRSNGNGYYENMSDGEVPSRGSLDDFLDHDSTSHGTRVLRTGRQRKKLAARTKGGEFQAKRKKRRVYFACISKEIDLQRVHDLFEAKFEERVEGAKPWQYTYYGDVLRLYREGPDEAVPIKIPGSNPASNEADVEISRADSIDGDAYELDRKLSMSGYWEQFPPAADPPRVISSLGNGAEVFVFDFGVAVFWGSTREEEKKMLELFRGFAVKGLTPDEFRYGEDDMAFVTSPVADAITISNDVISVPDAASAKQRLAVSFAIAQSTMLAIFESRIEQRIEEYKYIPEKLAESGKVFFSQTDLGKMIGDVFVIRHDVNLHTEILDTPDLFWNEKLYEPDYLMMSKYLEMTERTEVLNKRLDMLRELLEMIQQQMENDHAVKLEWIVIWLILMEVAIEIFGMMSKAIFGFSYK